MGIASYDVTGDGLPEVFLTSQGDNKLQTLADGAGAAELPGHRAPSAGSRRTDRTREATRCPPPPGTPEFQDVNNDGFIDLFISKGNVEAMPDFADEGPEQPAAGPAGRDVHRGRARPPAS